MNTKSFCTLYILLLSTIGLSQNHTIEKTGDYLQIVLPVTALASSITWNDNEKPINQFAKTMGATIVLTYSLKMSINKDRPNGATDGLSFPSGHTSSAFSGAAFLQRKHGWKIGIPAYIMAGYVGYSRINAKRHDIFDVLCGAMIGTSCAYIFTSKVQNRFDFRFSKQKNGFLFGVTMNFKNL